MAAIEKPVRLTYKKIKDALSLLVAKESSLGYQGYSDSTNKRDYKCRISDCKNSAYAKNLCNAHYLRQRLGRSLSLPILNRQRQGKCADCGLETSKNGGWGRCAHCYKNRRRKLFKSILVALFGGKCSGCKTTYPPHVFDFHHLGNKERPINLTYSIEIIAREISKCILVCANCHREIEYGH